MPRNKSLDAHIHDFGQFSVSTPPDLHMSLECERKPEDTYANTEKRTCKKKKKNEKKRKKLHPEKTEEQIQIPLASGATLIVLI